MKARITIEAVQWTGENYEEVIEFLQGSDTSTWRVPHSDTEIVLGVGEGIELVYPGEWIIKGTDGVCYPCRVPLEVEDQPGNFGHVPIGERARLREEVADLCHDQWSNWMDYLFSKCEPREDGSLVIPAWAVERWNRQMHTPYADLSEHEKDSDRAEADKFIALIRGERG